MKFIINTNYSAQSAGGRVLRTLCTRLAQLGHQVNFNDWSNYQKYDIAIFMAPDSEVEKAKKKCPGIVCGIFDPKLTLRRQIDESKTADFLIVSSLEQKEAFLPYGKMIIIYYMFPEVPSAEKQHINKDKIIIGYHGNKQHLDAMADVSWALDKLAGKYDIEFRAVYNINKLGRWRTNLPKICEVKHIQWKEDDFLNEVSNFDIGVVPSLMASGSFLKRPLRTFLFNPEGYSRNDYVLRFKMSNNPGRIYVFSQLNIPVVTDFTPSACEIIKNDYSGQLVGSRLGWYRALEKLILDHSQRSYLSSNLKKAVDESYSVSHNVNKLLNEIQKLIK
jgi:glycosyltransferase involved in cell wall biosynthesis